MQRVIAALTKWESDDGGSGRLRLLRDAGIEGAELLLDDELARCDVDEGALGALHNALQETGVRLSSCHLGGGNPAHAEVVAELERKLALAHRLGVQVVVAPAGLAESGEERDRLLGALRRVGDCAASYGITVALDTQPGLMQGWRGMRATIEELDHAQLRVNFDPGNILLYNPQADDETSLSRVADLVAHVHLHDSAGFSERSYGAVGCGSVNLFRIREVLDVCGFTGPYSLVLDQHPNRAAPSDAEYLQQLRESMENLRWCGYLD